MDESKMRTDISVAGMTCDHCVTAVSDELGKIPGVTQLEIVLAEAGPSSVTIESESELDRAAVASAISEAGYKLVDAG